MSAWRASRADGQIIPQTLQVPGDKSISHRAAMLAALASGQSEIVNFLPGSDCLATVAALEKLGAEVTWLDRNHLLIRGRSALRSPQVPLDCGNSGTSMRLLAGLLAGQNIAAELRGDASLSTRPMRRVVDPLRRMGARIEALGEDGRPPLRIEAGDGLRGVSYTPPMPSAQVKSSVLLAGLGARGQTCVRESTPTRDHTERMLPHFGVAVERSAGAACLVGGRPLRAARVDVPGDFSSAAFLLLAGIIGRVEMRAQHVGVNPARTGLLSMLERMGGNVQVAARGEVGAEPVADLVATPGALHGALLPASLVPAAIDEMPAVFAAAACASGQTVIEGASELRVKESDRITAMVEGLETLGVRCREAPDGASIQGGSVRGGEVDAHGDHRVAMAFSVLALAASEPIVVRGVEMVDTSFPGFADAVRPLGLAIEPID
ncbi:3-phosphoshikimate 1-carboxyvinyltransferase [Candidatus Foliamicus sp.]